MPGETPGTLPFPVGVVPTPAEVAPLVTLVPTRTHGHLRKQIRFALAISAARCVLTYVVVPVLSPLLQPSFSHDPRVAIPLSVTALVFDGRAVRSVWRSDLRWRWEIIAGYALLIAGIATLLAGDIWRLAQ
jgi:hypothetical protein